MNCNAKRSSANIFPRAAHYMSKSRMWLASRGLATPVIYADVLNRVRVLALKNKRLKLLKNYWL